MSKTESYAWGYTKSMVRRYPNAVNENEKKAVEAAIEATRSLKDGDVRLKIIDLVYFKGTHKMEGAAQVVHYSYDRVKMLHSDFIRAVGKNFKCQGLF